MKLEKAKQGQMRQGDVFLVPKKDAPEDSTPAVDGLVLARGEVTGHRHRLTGGRVVQSKGRTFAILESSQELVHEEHATLKVPEGTYEVIIQREYVESAERRVMD